MSPPAPPAFRDGPERLGRAAGVVLPVVIASSVSAAAVVVAALVAATAGTVGRLWRSTAAGPVRARIGVAPSPPPPDWFVGALADAGMEVDADAVWAALRVVAVVAGVAVAVRSPFTASVGAAIAVLAVAARRVVASSRAAPAYEAGLIAAVDRVGASLRSGASLAGAVGAAAELPGAVGTDLRAVLVRHQRGIGLQQALDGWAAQRAGRGDRGPALVADAVALAGHTGGSLTMAAEGVAATLRERQAVRREIRALGAQARASALVLVAVPVAFAVAVALADHRVAAFVVATPAGWACVAGGLALDAAGGLWMRRLTDAVS